MTTPGAGPDGALQDPEPPGRWRALGVLAAAMVLSMTTWFSATAVVPELRDQWGLSAATASWLTVSVQLGFVAGALASAAFNLADIVNPRWLMLYGSLGAAVANLALLGAGDLATALPLRLATGACLAVVYPPGLKAMATWFRAGRGTALGVMVGALTLGSALPHLVAGTGGIAWEAVIATTSALTVAGGALAVLVARDGPYPFPPAVFDPRLLGRMARNRPLVLASTGYFGHMWELYAMWAWFAPFMAYTLTEAGWETAERSASLITFAVIGIGAAGCWYGGRIGDRRGRPRATIVAMACSGASASIIGFLPGRVPVAAIVALGLFWGFFVVADSAQFSTAVTEVAEQHYVGTALTAQLALGFTLTIATIWLVPVVRDAAGWGWAFLALAPGPMLGIVAMAAAGRMSTHHAAPRRTSPTG